MKSVDIIFRIQHLDVESNLQCHVPYSIWINIDKNVWENIWNSTDDQLSCEIWCQIWNDLSKENFL